MVTVVKQSLIEQLETTFLRMKVNFDAQGAGWLQQARVRAFSHFKAQGLPTLSNEQWKYTHLNALGRANFDVHASQYNESLQNTTVENNLLLTEKTYKIVIVDGQFMPLLCSLKGMPKGVEIESMNHVMKTKSDKIQSHYKETEKNTPFVALNTAFACDGVYINIPAGTKLDHPIQLIHITTEQANERLLALRNIIIQGADSQVALIESYYHTSDAAYLANGVTQIELQGNAKLTHIKIQQLSNKAYYIDNTYVEQEKESSYTSHTISLTGKLIRNEINIGLNGAQATARVNGVYLTDAGQHVDNQLCIKHTAEKTQSDQFYKGILQGRSRAVFHGKVIVEKGAQKIIATQANHNLLLSEFSEIDTKPELQIYADDVKCSHGATVGQLDEDALFYLLSRGVNKDLAQHLLMYAFIQDVIMKIDDSKLRIAVNQAIIACLPQGQALKGFII